jgi:glycogen(starch) synthase
VNRSNAPSVKHLIVCPEFRLAAAGGIGVYVGNVAQLLAASGETVFVIAPPTPGGPERETLVNGRLVIHRTRSLDASATAASRQAARRAYNMEGLAPLTDARQSFALQAALLAEELVTNEQIDIIESQEYDAPMHVFQVRRALGLGPARQPPILVHLHSPTELIAQHNDWPAGRDPVLRTIRFETQSVRLADALLAPSRHLAAWAESRYGLGPPSVIPYPLGDTPRLSRHATVWHSGTICFVGRLEGRKGIHEWLTAAVAVARHHPTARFSFVGANATDFGWLRESELLERHVSADVRSRFVFHGPLSRPDLLAHLAGARIGVIPSRWDNFPNACMEMMATGLPVLATPEGGMAEMVDDGVTGWVAGEPGAAALARALERALSAGGDALASMGSRAADAIRGLCDNATVIDAHRRLRQEIAARGATRSLKVSSAVSVHREPTRSGSPSTVPGRAGVIVVAMDTAWSDDTVQALASQTLQPSAVVALVPENGLQPLPAAWVRQEQQIAEPPARALARAMDVLRDSNVAAVATLRMGDLPAPDWLAQASHALERQPEVDVVSFWTLGPDGQATTAPFPELPYNWLHDDTAAFSLIRADALGPSHAIRGDAPAGLELWDTVNGILARGGQAVTLPLCLGREASAPRRSIAALGPRERTFILSRDVQVMSRHALELLTLALSATPADGDAHALSMRGRFAAARLLVREPLRTLGWIVEVVRARYRRPLVPR